ncbi:outer membrane lipoprotein carrier protein LolA [Myroides pelagicus]|uniref:Outer membrane lipoprotein carrier protein LolA n=1 Tax=Myroides pelagicus TaxID=270914 RepID=A0A7K1GKN7_9FLAO|nr:outer membrane lipoprotein carrier protein LolA [Myroides pelagicus]MEC4113278.1 outer membrane lipoprotein carrier protein LolA [Myroides pelagicus]MTH29445.1 outer membrane lipoprotein carrier protein LolA [Myroides pelagicus]
MKKILSALLFLAMTTGAMAQEKEMNQVEITTFRKEVIAKTKEITSLSTDFIQYKHLSFMSKDIESKGSMLLQIPNKLLWKYSLPFEYSIAFKDNKISINDQGKKNKVDIGNNKKFAKINNLIVGSISGNMFDEKEFKISYFKSGKRSIAKLIPLSKDILQYISQIELYFDEGQSTVSEVKLIEPSADYTRIVFKNRQTNIKLNDSSFSN